MAFSRSHFTRARDGSYKVRLSVEERALIGSLPDQMEELLSSSSDINVRLFPPAYLNDGAHEEEYQGLMRDELIRRRVSALSVVRSTLSADRLTAEELDAWMRVLNDVRLVLGTALDVSEDEDPLPDGDDPQRIVYLILGGIVQDAVEALTQSLP